MDPQIKALHHQIKKARKVFLCLDYDGTLVPLSTTPENAQPDAHLYKLLDQLIALENVETAIITGRPRSFCEPLFKDRHLHLACEHGFYVKYAGSDWFQQQGAGDVTKLSAEVLSLLKSYQRLHPEVILEEKEASYVWHYGNVRDSEIETRSLNLAQELGQLLSGTTFGVYTGKKLVEVRPLMTHKGHAVDRVVEQGLFDPLKDILISMGDDLTDENMFKTQTPHNHSIFIGGQNVYSRYYFNEQAEVRPFLQQISEYRGA